MAADRGEFGFCALQQGLGLLQHGVGIAAGHGLASLHGSTASSGEGQTFLLETADLPIQLLDCARAGVPLQGREFGLEAGQSGLGAGPFCCRGGQGRRQSLGVAVIGQQFELALLLELDLGVELSLAAQGALQAVTADFEPLPQLTKLLFGLAKGGAAELVGLLEMAVEAIQALLITRQGITPFLLASNAGQAF